MDETLEGAAPCGLLTFNEEGVIEAANAWLHRLVGAAPGSLPGKPVASLLTVSSRIYFDTHFMPLLKLRGAVEEVYLPLRVTSGASIPVLINACNRNSAAGRSHYRCALMAMGERNRLEQALLEAKKAAEDATIAKDMFLAVLSHELRSPLAAMIGWTEVGLSSQADAAKKQRALEIVHKSASAQARLIEDLIDVSRIVSGTMRLHLQPVDLASTAGDAVETARTLASAKSVAIALNLKIVLPTVHADRDRLHQVVWNLLTNAIKFTPSGGSVTVSLRDVQDGIRLEVADTGRGIPAEQLPFLFDRFWQADYQIGRSAGLGLGLSICKKIVELHGGTIRVSSDGPDKGSTFSIFLPRQGR